MERFAGSHHDRAMQVADAGTVLGDFNTRGGNSLFRRRACL
jgi:hypothetical protein